MWKGIAYALLMASLVTATFLTLATDDGIGAFYPRLAWIVFLTAAFLSYFAFWRKGPGPAEHSENVGNEVP
jgi:uncharacterized membrane protein